jgi:hypothetical protein
MPATRNLCTALTTGATGAQAGIRLNRTPLHGGQGREGMLQLAAAVPAGATVLIQGHPSPLSDTPASGDAAWYTIATLTNASKLRQELSDLPYWARVNVSVSAAGTVTIDLEGTT